MSFLSLLAVPPLEQMRSLLVWSGHVLVRHVTMGLGQSVTIIRAFGRRFLFRCRGEEP